MANKKKSFLSKVANVAVDGLIVYACYDYLKKEGIIDKIKNGVEVCVSLKNKSKKKEDDKK